MVHHVHNISWFSLITMAFMLHTVRSEYLFRQSPGGDGYKSAGLWGGLTSSQQPGDAMDLYTYGYESLNISTVTQHGIDIEYLTFDPVSKRVLMVVKDPSGLVTSEKHSIAFGGLCKDNMAGLHATFHTFRLTDTNNPYLADGDCSWKCGWGPFGYYNNKIYFVLSGVFGKSYSNLQRKIQIREINGCEDVIDTLMNSEHGRTLFEFPVIECSKLITTLFEEKYTKPAPQINTWPAQELKVVEKDGIIHLFIQLFQRDNPNSEVFMKLMHINTLTLENVAEISSSAIEDVYSRNAKFTALGAIDYKNGFLCWTVTNKLHCGLYNLDGLLVDKTLIIDGETAINADVCHTGNLPSETLQQTLTGVAISDTSETLSIYFGCYADFQATGGLGLIQISHHGLNRQIFPVKSGSHRVYGGYLFLSDTVDAWCDYSTSSSSQSQDKTSTREGLHSTPPWSESLPSLSIASPISPVKIVLLTALALCINQVI